MVSAGQGLKGVGQPAAQAHRCMPAEGKCDSGWLAGAPQSLTQPVCRAHCDEELAAVGVGAAVGLRSGSSKGGNGAWGQEHSSQQKQT